MLPWLRNKKMKVDIRSGDSERNPRFGAKSEIRSWIRDPKGSSNRSKSNDLSYLGKSNMYVKNRYFMITYREIQKFDVVDFQFWILFWIFSDVCIWSICLHSERNPSLHSQRNWRFRAEIQSRVCNSNGADWATICH